MKHIILVVVCVLAIAKEGQCQECGEPITPVAMSATTVEVKSLTLDVIGVGNNVYRCRAKAMYNAYTDVTSMVPMQCYSSLQVGETGGLQDVIETPHGSWVSVPPGASVSWTFDNTNPGPAPTFVGASDSTWRAFGFVLGTQVGMAPISDADIVLKDSSNQPK